MAARVSWGGGGGIFDGYRANLIVFRVWCMEQTDTNDPGQGVPLALFLFTVNMVP